MKKIAIYITLLLSLVLLTSCEKESYCWDCKKDTWMPGAYTSYMMVVCDMTYEQRGEFEKSNTSDNGVVKQLMTCHLR